MKLNILMVFYFQIISRFIIIETAYLIFSRDEPNTNSKISELNTQTTFYLPNKHQPK